MKKDDEWLAIYMGTIALIVSFFLSLPAKALGHTDLHDNKDLSDSNEQGDVHVSDGVVGAPGT